jgi:hypothetical protein
MGCCDWSLTVSGESCKAVGKRRVVFRILIEKKYCGYSRKRCVFILWRADGLLCVVGLILYGSRQVKQAVNGTAPDG